jgi:dihydroorotase-like cyclic amidohydrolase
VSCPTHISNVSSAAATYELTNHKRELPGLSFDNAAAYLYFSEDDVGVGETKFKTNPPIREARNKKLLIELL